MADYWLSLADYDFATAKSMLKAKRYIYVGFMCHQTIEKALKAIIARDCSEGDMPPKIHNLVKLSIRANVAEEMNIEQQDFLADLNPLNIEARYPEYKEKIAQTLDKKVCRNFINKTEELLCWIKERL